MAAERPAGFLTRLGALFTAPRALARRDLDHHDGKAGDDLILVMLLALLAGGAAHLVRGVQALSAGRASALLGLASKIFAPAVVFLVAWVIASLVLRLLCWRMPDRAVGELGARVATALCVTSLAIAPFAGALPRGPLRHTLEAAPWAAAAVLFGLVLREALEPLGIVEEGQGWTAPRGARAMDAPAAEFQETDGERT